MFLYHGTKILEIRTKLVKCWDKKIYVSTSYL